MTTYGGLKFVCKNQITHQKGREMLYSTGHGSGYTTGGAEKKQREGFEEEATVFEGPRAVVMSAPRAAAIEMDTAAQPTSGAFGYIFPDAPAFPKSDTMVAALDALGNSMFDPAIPSPDVDLAPILTYFGQFIDHDITANTDRRVEGVSEIDADPLVPTDRATVTDKLDNLRDGSLGLDSLYGDSVGQDAFSQKLSGLMRHPLHTAKMRLGVPLTTGDDPIRPPADDATDLLRLGFLLDRADLTEAELQDLDEDRKAAFIGPDGQPIRQRAIIGDFRNDENLLVGQLQVAFLRLHNKLVDEVGDFDEARRLTRYHYQWLVANEYLPSLCDRSVVDELIATASPLYAAFFQTHEPSVAPKMPMPLEFSVAAFRFGHTMVRGRYDHNHVFGRPVDGLTNREPFASLDQLFLFTGDGRMSIVPPNGGSPISVSDTQLPDNWVIDWSRFVNAETPVRSIKGVDSRLDTPLDVMINQGEPSRPPELNALFQNLARRNLRRGYRLNLPSAQDMIAGINASGHFRPIQTLAPDVVMANRTIEGADFGTTTPLWFYVLREAETVGAGHLGPLGTHIVAGTLLGLIMKDPSSYWNDNSAGHRWLPSTFRPSAPIDSLKEMLRFTGQLA